MPVNTRFGTILRTLLLGSAILPPLVATPAAAQQAEAPEASEQGGLTEIVVTARRREESLQDVPVSVTALSAAQIQKYDMTSLEKISTQTPQFTIGRSSNG